MLKHLTPAPRMPLINRLLLLSQIQSKFRRHIVHEHLPLSRDSAKVGLVSAVFDADIVRQLEIVLRSHVLVVVVSDDPVVINTVDRIALFKLIGDYSGCVFVRRVCVWLCWRLSTSLENGKRAVSSSIFIDFVNVCPRVALREA